MKKAWQCILVLLILATSCIPTVSQHSFRRVEISLHEANSGKPVSSMPFRVDYNPAATDSPLFYHWELRTPKNVCAETDEHGQAVITLADYAWDTYLTVNDTNRHYFSMFALAKQVIRDGGTVYQWNEVPPKNCGEGYSKLELQVRPLNRPNPQGGANGRQPVSSDTNSTSAAAATRRSP